MSCVESLDDNQIISIITFQDYAWELAQAIYRHARVSPSEGFAQVKKVDKIPINQYMDTQPSEFLSATLKYLYLTFAPDDYMSLQQWVFNAAGHPLPICGKNPAYPKGVCGSRNAFDAIRLE